MATRVITGNETLDGFCKAMGIEGRVRRAVIDIPVDGAVTIYVEQYADSDRFEIALNLLKDTHYQIKRVTECPATPSA